MLLPESIVESNWMMSFLLGLLPSVPMMILLGSLILFIILRFLYLVRFVYQHRSKCAELNRTHVTNTSPFMSTTNDRQSKASLFMGGSTYKGTQSAPMMIVLGSGGHTGEMLCLLSSLDFNRYYPRYYVVANTDRSSETRVVELERDNATTQQLKKIESPSKRNPELQYEEQLSKNTKEFLKNLNTKSAPTAADTTSSNSKAQTEFVASSSKGESSTNHPYTIHRIPRSREVKQSYFTSIFTTIRAYFSALYLIYSTQPSLLLVNGPGTCLPVVLAVWTWRIFFFSYCRIIFIESFCRVRSVSLCGKLLYILVDRFIVQWPQLREQYSLTEYIGRLC